MVGAEAYVAAERVVAAVRGDDEAAAVEVDEDWAWGAGFVWWWCVDVGFDCSVWGAGWDVLDFVGAGSNSPAESGYAS